MTRISGLISLILAVSILLGATVINTCATTNMYSDVKSTRWSAENIAYVTEKGYMNGVGNGLFAPDRDVTRGMVVTVLYRLNGAGKMKTKNSFTDVSRKMWYADAVDWANFHGIVKGISSDTFSPDVAISREALATMMYRYAVSTGIKETTADKNSILSKFGDSDSISSWATDAVAWAVENGVINGTPEGKLEPRKTSTREQFAAILQRYNQGSFEYVFEDVMNQIADESERELEATLNSRANGSNVSMFNWRDGMLLVGLCEAGRLEYVKKYIDAFIEHGDEVYATDCGVAGYAVCALYEKYGDTKYANLCHRIMDAFDEWPTDSNGQIKYDENREPDAQDVFVDGTGFATIFLGRYAKLFGDERVRKLAILQIDNYLKYGVNSRFGLVYHGYSNSSEQKGEMGWGRGTGWFMLAVGSVMNYCGDDDINERCSEFVEKTMTYLLDTDNFSWSLGDRKGQSDTSATGPIMWGILKAKENRDLLSGVSVERIKSIAYACLSDVEDGVVYGASGESGGWYSYSDEFGNYKWGQGGILAFYGLLVQSLNK